MQIKGEEPDRFDRSVGDHNLYGLYPNDFYGFDKPKCRMKLSIEVISE